MYPQNRWFGLFVPGRDLLPLDVLTTQLIAKPAVAGYFVRFDSRFTVETLDRFGDRGITPFLTLEPWMVGMKAQVMDPAFNLPTLNTGTHDQDLARIAAAVALYGDPVYLRLAHEMNGHWYPWAVGQNGNTAADYLQFWKRVRGIFSDAGASNVKWVWSCAAVQGLRMGAPDVASVFPGDDQVDYAGTTGYGWDIDAQTTYGKTFTKLEAITSADFLIPEMGAQQPVNKVGVTSIDWTRSLAEYLRTHPRIRGFVWFDIDPSIGATGDYRLSGNPGTITALNELITQVPIISNTLMSEPNSTVGGYTPAPDAQGYNPTASTFATNIVKGHACDPRGPKYGFDKYGNPYQCVTTPQGWSRWEPKTP